jgi:transposase-like protein
MTTKRPKTTSGAGATAPSKPKSQPRPGSARRKKPLVQPGPAAADPEARAPARKQPVDYEPEFKRGIAQMILDGQAPFRLAKDFGLSRSMIYRWRDAELARLGRAGAAAPDEEATMPEHQAFKTGPTAAELAAENARLRRQLTIVEQEREILKKALSVVTKPT